MRLTGQQRMKYKTIGALEDAGDAELRNVTQMTDQRLKTKECRFGLKFDKTTKASWGRFASSFCIQPAMNNTSTKQLRKMRTRLDIEAKRQPSNTSPKGGEVVLPYDWRRALLDT